MIQEAAIRTIPDMKVYTGRRHSDIIRANVNVDFAFSQCEQGFITDKGEFVSRSEAAKIAYKCGQIKEQKRQLFSEDLY